MGQSRLIQNQVAGQKSHLPAQVQSFKRPPGVSQPYLLKGESGPETNHMFGAFGTNQCLLLLVFALLVAQAISHKVADTSCKSFHLIHLS